MGYGLLLIGIPITLILLMIFYTIVIIWHCKRCYKDVERQLMLSVKYSNNSNEDCMICQDNKINSCLPCGHTFVTHVYHN